MAETSSDAFLTGQGVPVDLHDVETELIRLWGPPPSAPAVPTWSGRTSRGSSWPTSSSKSARGARRGSTRCSTP